ncbi:hypothetical protein [uncultured Marivita sp.]|uniref:hypothetical protein n=1 Tax=uncultured Marivita sp. TaxID=888080 RepID=UPI002638E2E3|nr:hypothetical protein [uncultured Marivita sp.]
MQNRALERAGEVERVDHRWLEAQHEAALDREDQLSAEELDRDPELKLGPAANSMERRAKAMAQRQGREYVAVTERGAQAGPEDVRERLARVVGRSEDWDDTPKPESRNYARERLKENMEKDAGRDGQAAVHKLDGHSDPELGEETGREERKPSVNERLKDVLNKPREKLEIEDERDQEKDRGVENEREIDREIDRDPGLSH